MYWQGYGGTPINIQALKLSRWVFKINIEIDAV